MSQQSFYAGRASGIRMAIDTLEILCESSHGYRFGAKTLAARAKTLLQQALDEERHLCDPQPETAQP